MLSQDDIERGQEVLKVDEEKIPNSRLSVSNLEWEVQDGKASTGWCKWCSHILRRLHSGTRPERRAVDVQDPSEHDD